MPHTVKQNNKTTQKMRTKTLLLAVAALAASLAISKAQPVYSANVVGYVNVPLLGYPNYTFIANPVDSGNNVLTNTLQSLPIGSKVYKWDYANSAFDLVFTRSTLGAGGWSAGSGTNTDNPGEGFFVLLASTNTVGFTNTFVGTVLQGNLTNTILPGYTVESFPVPITDTVTNQGLNAVLPSSPSGSQLLQWDLVNQDFDLVHNRGSLGSGWSGGVPQVTPGAAFFIFNNSANTYQWGINFTVQ
jgi:hypothetical protein